MPLGEAGPPRGMAVWKEENPVLVMEDRILVVGSNRVGAGYYLCEVVYRRTLFFANWCFLGPWFSPLVACV